MMIKVTYDLAEGFRVKGHAEYAEKGNDIVCAGVTACIYTSLFNLQRAVGEGNVKFINKKDETIVHVVTTTTSSLRIIESFVEFIERMQKQYPSNVTIKGGK